MFPFRDPLNPPPRPLSPGRLSRTFPRFSRWFTCCKLFSKPKRHLKYRKYFKTYTWKFVFNLFFFRLKYFNAGKKESGFRINYNSRERKKREIVVKCWVMTSRKWMGPARLSVATLSITRVTFRLTFSLRFRCCFYDDRRLLFPCFLTNLTFLRSHHPIFFFVFFLFVWLVAF